MSKAKLNVWVRDLKCDIAIYAKVKVVDCKGRNIAEAPLAKLPREIEVPPGCYIVRAYACYYGPDGKLKNYYSDRSMVIVRCGEEACVTLVIPEFVNCAKDIALPFVENALLMKIPDEDIRKMVGVLAKAADIPQKKILEKVDLRINDLKDAKEDDIKKHVADLKNMKKFLK